MLNKLIYTIILIGLWYNVIIIYFFNSDNYYYSLKEEHNKSWHKIYNKFLTKECEKKVRYLDCKSNSL